MSCPHESNRVALCLLATLGVLLSAQVCAQTAPVTPDVKSLAAAMELSQSTRIGIEASVQKAIQQGYAKPGELDCMKAANFDFVVEVYSRAIASALSAEEVKQAIAFFSSPAGQAYTRYSRSLELKARGVPDANPKTELTDAEQSATMKFLEKSAGKKLLEQHAIETPELRASLTREVSALVQKCRK
jgi:hypothetical protein